MLKNQGVTAEPEIRQWRVTPADMYIVLASDGLWCVLPRANLPHVSRAVFNSFICAHGSCVRVHRDVLSNNDVGQYVSTMSDPEVIASVVEAVTSLCCVLTWKCDFAPARSVQMAAKRLTREALARGSTDNITCLVVDLQHPQYKELAAGMLACHSMTMLQCAWFVLSCSCALVRFVQRMPPGTRCSRSRSDAVVELCFFGVAFRAQRSSPVKIQACVVGCISSSHLCPHKFRCRHVPLRRLPTATPLPDLTQPYFVDITIPLSGVLCRSEGPSSAL